MRFLIVAAAILSCAAAVPSGALLASSYSSGLLAHGARLAYAAPVAVPTISPGDIQGAAIDAQVKASDNVRAAVDAVQQFNDQAREIQGRAYNAAEDYAWQAVNEAQTASAKVDGAAASISPIAARQLAGNYEAAPAIAAYSSPVVAARAFSAYAAPVVAAKTISGYAAPAISYSAPFFQSPIAYGHGLARAW